MKQAQVSTRSATVDDIDLILDLIKALSVYERLADTCVISREDIRQALFTPNPSAEVLIGEVNGEPVGFALFFHNYSTFLGKKGLYLEDLFVRPEARGYGVGKRLLRDLARIAIERDCARMEWAVLDWNTPSISFYKSLGAVPLEEWTVFRLTADRMASLAKIE